MHIAILTADIVNSTALSAPAASALRSGIEQVFAGKQIEFFRGDSFQVLIKEPADALRPALRARSLARSQGPAFDIRCSIGIGTVAHSPQQLATATGTAFLLSGRAFDSLGDQHRLALVSEHPEHNAALRILAAYCDHLFGALTAKQASVVYALLSGKTQIETAATLNVTQATISNHAHSAGWPQIEFLLREYEALFAPDKTSS